MEARRGEEGGGRFLFLSLLDMERGGGEYPACGEGRSHPPSPLYMLWSEQSGMGLSFFS